MQEAVAANTRDEREHVRSSVFLTAVLAYGGRSDPVRVRNISVTGALLDGTALPPEGTAVLLRRAELCAAAEIAWQGSKNAGIRFAEPIDIEPWVARVGHSGQRRVDDILATIRTGEISNGAFNAPSRDTLQDISSELTRMSEDFSNLPTLTLELAEKVLQLDAVAQRLRNWVGS